MARRRRPEKREILPDPKFGDIVLSKFMNSVDRKSTRLNSSHVEISYAVFCLKKKKNTKHQNPHLAHDTPDEMPQRHSAQHRTLYTCKPRLPIKYNISPNQTRPKLQLTSLSPA